MTRLHRRNFLPAFILNLILLVITILIVFLLGPEKSTPFQISNFKFQIFLNIILFFLCSFLFLAFTLSLLLAQTRRGFLISLLINTILFLRLIRQAQWWNIVLLVGFFSCLELFFSKRNKKPETI